MNKVQRTSNIVVSFVVLVLLLALFEIESINSEQIRINNNADSSYMIDSITHKINESKILIQIRDETNCTEAFFFVRLSGAALLSPLQIRESTFIYSFPYQISVTGIYHLEILFFGCDFQPDYADNIMNRCLITPPEMTINMPYQVKLDAQYQLPGWVNVKEEKFHNLISTRFFKDASNINGVASNAWVSNYEFVGLVSTHDYFYALEKMAEKVSVEDTFNFCFMGASHSRNYLHAINEILPSMIKKNKIIQKIRFKLISLILFDSWDSLSNMERINNCTVGVVGMGQWAAAALDAGYKKPHGAKEFRAAMAKIVDKFKIYSNTKFYLRSIHQNGLKWMKLSCPPTD